VTEVNGLIVDGIHPVPLDKAWAYYGDKAPGVLRQGIKLFYANVIEDDMLKGFFRNSNIKTLSAHQFDVVSFAMGRKDTQFATLKDLTDMLYRVHLNVKNVDTGRGIDNPAHYHTGFHLISALLTVGVSPSFTQGIVPLWTKLAPFIVTEKDLI